MSNYSLFNNDYLTMKESAELLGVSAATISNWVRLGTLRLADNSVGRRLLRESVLILKEEIATGKNARLKSRANKQHVAKRRVHKEINDPHIESYLAEIDSISIGDKVQSILIALAKQVLQNEVKKNVAAKNFVWVELCKKEIELWESEAGTCEDVCIKVADDVLRVVDILGKTYQHISESRAKAVGGVFYTPTFISKKIISDNLKRHEVVFDPCCGSGSFLIESLSKKIMDGDENPSDCIIGCDIDPIAVHICRLNLLFLGKEKFAEMPKIEVRDVLAADVSDGKPLLNYKVDLVATNPPWGSKLTQVQKNSECASDSFSLFLKLAIENVRTYGKIAFLLPESFVDVAIHSQIRKKLLAECDGIEITKLGKAFSGMLTDVVLVEARVGGRAENARVVLRSRDDVTTESHMELLAKKYSEFTFDIDGSKSAVIAKIQSYKHKYLGAESDYSLGIVTGNNAKLVLSEKYEGCEGILKGKDIKPFIYAEPSSFIKFDRSSFQQCSDERYFRAEEKLIYRFISDKLIFSYDEKQVLTLNSANFIIPKIGIPTKVVLAILQSSVSQFLFEAKFNSVKILKKHIQALPIFEFDDPVNLELVGLVDEILNGKCADHKINLKKINRIIYDQLQLNEAEIKLIEAR